ncbi:hypothetical protein Ahy_B02g058695 [Arachis hypogaea]|uniref:MULE transposase domain-containing protein n=1 Tax=Arachis hypogaea TaxID=3818 RepID=A0A445AF51_ARAHY|nr:hypothetical protein Ahy_B02g058695 [Arachis hypogaea]
MAQYNVTMDDMLANLFWANGGNMLDYQYFGDVLAFDSIYKKNKCKRPLVIFSGGNNHKKTCIFGFGLVLDESIASYTWLLENFLEVMCNKLFNWWLYADMVVEDFETEWVEASAKFGLNGTLWENQVYGKREMWANAYLHDKFCARNNELLSQFRSTYGDPVLTTSLDSIEGFAARVYTQAVFNHVKKKIEVVTSVNFVGFRGRLPPKCTQ